MSLLLDLRGGAKPYVHDKVCAVAAEAARAAAPEDHGSTDPQMNGSMDP